MCHKVTPFLNNLRKGYEFTVKADPEERETYVKQCITEANLRNEPNCAIIFLAEYLLNHCHVPVTAVLIHKYYDKILGEQNTTSHLHYLMAQGVIKEHDSTQELRLTV